MDRSKNISSLYKGCEMERNFAQYTDWRYQMGSDIKWGSFCWEFQTLTKGKNGKSLKDLSLLIKTDLH